MGWTPKTAKRLCPLQHLEGGPAPTDKDILSKSNICRAESKSRCGERRPPRQHVGRLQEFFSPPHRFYGINFGVNNCQIQGDQTAKLQNWMKHVARALQLAVHSDFSISRTLPEPTIRGMHVLSALSFPGSKAVINRTKEKMDTLL